MGRLQIFTQIWLIFQKGPFDKFQLGLRFQHFGSFVGLGSKYPTHIEDHHSTLLYLLYNVQPIVLVLGRHKGTMILTPFPITAGASLPQLVAGCLTSIQGDASKQHHGQLVVEPTHLKNMQSSNRIISPNRDEHKKCLKPPSRNVGLHRIPTRKMKKSSKPTTFQTMGFRKWQPSQRSLRFSGLGAPLTNCCLGLKGFGAQGVSYEQPVRSTHLFWFSSRST